MSIQSWHVVSWETIVTLVDEVDEISYVEIVQLCLGLVRIIDYKCIDILYIYKIIFNSQWNAEVFL